MRAGDEADDDRSPRCDEAGRRRDGDECRNGAVQHHREVGLAQHDPRRRHRTERAGGCGEVRRHRDVREVADPVAGHDSERRAWIEAEPAEPEHEDAERDVGHVVARNRVRLAVRVELPDARSEEDRPGERGQCSLVVNDGRASEVLHPTLEQPAVRRPDPVGHNGVDEREEDAEDEVHPQLRPLCHRSPDDCECNPSKDDLEEVARACGNRREPGERSRADREQVIDARREARAADETRAAVSERESVSDEVVDDGADREDEDVLRGDVPDVLHPREPCLEEREARLHEHHENRGYNHPDRARCDGEVDRRHSYHLLDVAGPQKKPQVSRGPEASVPFTRPAAVARRGHRSGGAGRLQVVASRDASLCILAFGSEARLAPHRERLRDRPCDASATCFRARCQARSDVSSEEREDEVPAQALRCRACEREHPLEAVGVCAACFGPLDPVYDMDAGAGDIHPRGDRGGAQLDLALRAAAPRRSARRATPGAGLHSAAPCAAARRARSGSRELHLKLDTANPTHSFKDRVVAVAAAKALELGSTTLVLLLDRATSRTQSPRAPLRRGSRRSSSARPTSSPRSSRRRRCTGRRSTPSTAATTTARGSRSSSPSSSTGRSSTSASARTTPRARRRSPSRSPSSSAGGSRTRSSCPIASGRAVLEGAPGLLASCASSDSSRATAPRLYGGQAEGCAPVATAFAEGRQGHPAASRDTVCRSLAIGNPADGDLAIATARASRRRGLRRSRGRGRREHGAPRRDERRLRRDRGRRDARRTARSRAARRAGRGRPWSSSSSPATA